MNPESKTINLNNTYIFLKDFFLRNINKFHQIFCISYVKIIKPKNRTKF